ncbi:MAG: chemotaxis protein CheA [Armatimonadetes bacterium]|nr:chemotaxis protein CheA [Armatimonadota bacterium]
MSSELDMSQYIDLFLQEAEEQLEILETETLALENDPSQDRMQIIFRAAHTLKGSSRAMGFSRFAELTHEMENVLDQLRNDALEISTEITDRLLACVDTLSQMVEQIGQGNGDNVECGVLVKQLQDVLAGAGIKVEAEVGASAPVETASPEPQEAPKAEAKTEEGFPSKLPEELHEALTAAAEEGNVYHAKFRLEAECVMKFVRAFMAISVIQESGELLACVPSQEELEEEQFETEFELVFQSDNDFEELKTKLSQISEVESAWVTPWATPSGESAPAEAVVEAPEAEEAKPEPVAKAAPAPAPAAAANNANAARKADTGQTVRVDVARLDNLMNLVGELVIDRTRIAQIGNELATNFTESSVENLTEIVGHIARITSDLQDQIMKARMLPIETVFNRFPRVVRDLANKLGKDVKLELIGGDTELDRSVIEVIGDPLLHILRNSIDHGIEMPNERTAAGKSTQGLVQVAAKHEENHIVIEIRDDGKGIDPERVKKKAVEQGLISEEAAAKVSDKEALQFIFHSGLSTAAEVSEVSGRGVGMDIVRSNIQRLGGIIDLESTVGQGSRTILRLPLTLAIIRGLLVNVEKNVFVLPLGSVVETLLVQSEDIQTINRKEVVVIRGCTTPLFRLGELFGQGMENPEQPADEHYVVIVGLAEQRLGLIVDRLIGEQEVVIKSMSRFCGDVPGISGATILGDGNVALILDVNGVIKSERAA